MLIFGEWEWKPGTKIIYGPAGNLKEHSLKKKKKKERKKNKLAKQTKRRNRK